MTPKDNQRPDDEWGLARLTDLQLVERFNGDVGNPGWVGARGRFHHAIFSEFKKREIDFICIETEPGTVSLAHKVKLVNKKLICLKPAPRARKRRSRA